MNSNIPVMPLPVPAPEAPAADQRMKPHDMNASEQDGFSRVLDREVRAGSPGRRSKAREAGSEDQDASSREETARTSESGAGSENETRVDAPEDDRDRADGEKATAAEGGRENGKELPQEAAGGEGEAQAVVPPFLVADAAFEGEAAAGEVRRNREPGGGTLIPRPFFRAKEDAGIPNPLTAGQRMPPVPRGSENPATGEAGKVLETARMTLETLVRDAARDEIEKAAERFVTTASRWNGTLREFSTVSAEVLQRLGESVQNAPGGPSGNTPSTAGIESQSAGLLRPFRLDIPAAFGQPGWDRALGEKVTWMIGQQLHAAEIRVNPPQLGPLEVRIQVQNDQTQIHFHTQHAVVREAIESALPRLREMMSQAGVDLGQVSIADHSEGRGRHEHAGQPESGMTATGTEPDGEEAASHGEIGLRRVRGHGGLDLFA